MTVLLALVATLQGPAPALTAGVDRVRLRVGETLTLRVRARTRSAAPLDLTLPSLAGFTLLASREMTEVTFASGAPVRVTTREIDLRAARPGTLVIGPVVARQDGRVARTDPITVTVDAAGAVLGLSPVGAALLAAAPPPGTTDQVTLHLIVSADTVLAGAQVDVVAAAWFPRELRNALARDPVLTLPTPVGAWTYPPETPPGVVTSRVVRGHWMDLYAAHEVLFPLAAGRVVLPPATLDYAVPVQSALLTREERYALASDSVVITSLAPPAAGRPADYRGVVADDVGVTVTADTAPLRVGEPWLMGVHVSGTGNVALWPEPAASWPAALHVYPGAIETQVDARGGQVAGTRTFRYLVVPDSAGSAAVPAFRFTYFSPVQGRYVTAAAPARPVVIGAGYAPATEREAVPLLAPLGAPLARRLARGLGAFGWAALAAFPPLVVGVARRRRRPAAAPPVAGESFSRLGRLEREFLAALTACVPDARARDGDGLASALRAAGLEAPVADHVVRLRDRIRAARYGPSGAADSVELAAEVEQVLKVLGAEHGGRRRRIALVVVAAVAVGAAGPLRAQGGAPETLYRAGALRVAVDSFAARADAHPDDAGAWYDLAAALYRAGADGKAEVAWIRAARLAPRNAAVRHLGALLPSADPITTRLAAADPVTPAELAFVAMALWWVAWAAALARRRRRTVVALVVLALLAAGFAGLGWWRRGRPVAIVTADRVLVRAAPYGSAGGAASLDAGAAVLVERRYGGWLEVRRPDGIRGWVLAGEVTAL